MLAAFEIEAFFTFTATERQVIEQRRQPALKLGLALQIGFLRMSGRVLDAVRIVPAVLWRHLGEQFNVAAPDLASLRAMYGRGNTLFEHQQLACEVLSDSAAIGATFPLRLFLLSTLSDSRFERSRSMASFTRGTRR